MITIALAALALAANGSGGATSDWWIVGQAGGGSVLIDRQAIEAENAHTSTRSDVSTFVTFVDPGAAEPIRQQFVGLNCKHRSFYFGVALFFSADGRQLRTDPAPTDGPAFGYAQGASYDLLCGDKVPSDPAAHLGNVPMSGLVRALAKRR
jgi:hypothetical protein